MNAQEIKAQIRLLPDDDVGPLLEWLKDYYDGEVWDRQIDADVQRLGPEEFTKRLQQEMEDASEPRQAALRLLNSMHFKSDSARQAYICDVETMLGSALLKNR
ncbi:MAG: hypothetical protein JWL59_4368 [Chthoniobacteraceae bacterium]|nr:hypothetical protein [Chthoniobacteraceae bacterium]